jgi:hypothetical protein
MFHSILPFLILTLLISCSKKSLEQISTATPSSTTVSNVLMFSTSTISTIAPQASIPVSMDHYPIRNVVYKKYITFFVDYPAAPGYLATFIYDPIKTYYGYSLDDAIFLNPGAKNYNPAEYWYIDSLYDQLIIDIGTSSAPHAILFIDFSSGKKILSDNYYYPNEFIVKNNKVLILKYIGQQISNEQRDLIDMDAYNARKEIFEKYKDQIHYYSEHYYNLETRVVEDINLIFPALFD